MFAFDLYAEHRRTRRRKLRIVDIQIQHREILMHDPTIGKRCSILFVPECVLQCFLTLDESYCTFQSHFSQKLVCLLVVIIKICPVAPFNHLNTFRNRRRHIEPGVGKLPDRAAFGLLQCCGVRRNQDATKNKHQAYRQAKDKGMVFFLLHIAPPEISLEQHK